jgi:oxalate decarboxylase
MHMVAKVAAKPVACSSASFAHRTSGHASPSPWPLRAEKAPSRRNKTMNPFSRRDILAVGAAGGLLTATSAMAQTNAQTPQPNRSPGIGGMDPGPRDLTRDRENPDMLNPPPTDSGTLPNLRFSFADAHTRQTDGGWTRQVTQRELGISTTMAGVDMRLNAGSIREMHWHKQAEWAYMLYGTARITAIDQDGNNFVDDVGVGDLWYFPGGIPHSIQGLGPDGCEFLLVFDDGFFDEDDTFLISDWFKHIPEEVLGKNFGVPGTNFAHLPSPEQRYIFKAQVPGALGPDKLMGAKPVPQTFKHRLMAQDPIRTKGGTVRIADSSIFPASKTIAAALVEVEPGGMRELHWHPNVDEWQYYLEGQGRMGVFAAQGAARTFDYRGGDVGYVPFGMGHYIENTGDTPLRFLEMFRSSYFADLSLNQWMALTPAPLLQAHFPLPQTVMDNLHKKKSPIVPA